MDIKKSFETYFVSAFKQYFDFKNRTSKKAYWMFVLYSMLIGWAVIALDNILGTEEAEFITIWGVHYGMFHNFYSLILLVPGLAIAVRRLHDVGKKGNSLLMILIPVFGFIWLIIHLAKDGDPETNEYGPVPEDGEDPQTAAHPYASPQGRSDDKADKSEDLPAVRKDVEQRLVKQEKPKNKIEKVDRTVKRGRDRGAKDFRTPVDKKRKK